ncbi:SDR family NAD(P)-dependent oxidoreductase [Sphingomonas immobilis]|uniref:SDR family oxidoreductase n=1 Tax=Sphingomonas immobilis TaxID=3063997 RepID=A0ABT8ZX87_9SPHN|nr:SDR family oxidoreductase [Sphingomonas sp. CA1-15]MDO7842185.1 SDR family oxidoreductase [Sphingomonas sp. CA1-15]
MTGTDVRRVALITGGARGLGRAVGEALAAEGAALFLVDILGDRLATTKAELTAQGFTVETFTADIAERAQCIAAVEAAVAAYGRLDVLCNVAAIVRFNHATDVPEAEYARVMAVNAAAPFWFCQAAIPHLIETRGNIVNVASQAGLMGCPYIVPYAASKGAVVQMTKSLAMEYMDAPIRINAVCPGTMATEIGEGNTMPEGIDMAKVLRYSGQRPATQASEVAALIAFVASPAASAVQGAILTADGGVTAG